MQQASTKPRIVIFLVCTFFYWSAVYTYNPTMTPYLADLGISFSMIGLIGGSYGFAQMLLRVPVGVMSDRLGKRKLFIIFGVIAGAVSTSGMFFTQNAFLILALRLLAGVSASAWVVFTILFTGYFEKNKHASRISYLFMVNGFALMFSKLFGGLVAENYGHEYTFVLGGAAGIIAIILSLFITEKTPEAKELPSLKKLFGVIKNPNLIAMSILAIFLQMVMFATINTFTPEAATRAGADLMMLGILATVSSVPAIISSFLCGRLFSRYKINIRHVVASGFALQMAGALIIPFTNSMTAVFVSTIILGFGCGICMSTLLGFCTITVDEGRRSAAMGFFQAIYGFGMFIGPVITGIFVDWSGLSGGFFASAAFALTGLVLTFLLSGIGHSNDSNESNDSNDSNDSINNDSIASD